MLRKARRDTSVQAPSKGYGHAKLNICWELLSQKRKYIYIFLLLALAWQVSFSVEQSEGQQARRNNPSPSTTTISAEDSVRISKQSSARAARRARKAAADSLSRQKADTIPVAAPTAPVTVPGDPNQINPDSIGFRGTYTPPERTPKREGQRVVDTTQRKEMFDDIIYGKNEDSLIYDLDTKMVYVYEKGDIKYQNMTLKADFMRINMDTKQIRAYGREDTVSGKPTRPEFVEGSATYTMDTINYNLDTKKAKIKGVATQEGEGYLIGDNVKKMPDNTIFISHGKYTTCNQVDHPHFYIAMTKSKTIPGKKVVVGPSYFVMEDVPIYFLGLPFGFFPISSSHHSGFILPEYGEEVVKGFFIRNGGYYFAFNDYIDMTVLGGYYTLGSWEASLASRYVKRYKFSGALNINYSKDIMGEKGAADYYNMGNFQMTWSHQQDPKFRPNSTFSASVNFSTSGYSKYGAQNMNDYLNTQTNSSIAYSKNWAGTPFSLSANLQHSQNSHDTTIALSIPNIVFNMSRIYPFRRKNAVGKQAWYEKISMSYTANMTNNVTVKENELFTEKMFKEMKNGIQHRIPINTSINLLKYINLSPNANYNERWYFRKIDKEWDPTVNQVVNADTTYGFYRLYDYDFAVSASTKIYGTFTFKKGSIIQAIRHVMTPSVGFTYAPDFSSSGYGYYKPVQTDSTGTIGYYSPWQDGIYGIPGKGQRAALTFSLGNTLEMKVRNRQDSTGTRKIKILDNLSIASSYNFLADSLNLAPFAINLRAPLAKSISLNVSATLDPYQINENGQKINRFMLKDGKIGRITSATTSFGYSFNSSNNPSGARNDINSAPLPVTADQASFFGSEAFSQLDANTRRQMMTSQYYDFNIPWNFGFNYSFSYSRPGHTATITQTLGFNGSFNLTPKWGVTFDGGYDFKGRKVTPGTISVTRDLHCWQMSFSWVPIGFRKSWSFSINVKSALLKDIKYDKNNSFYDNLYGD